MKLIKSFFNFLFTLLLVFLIYMIWTKQDEIVTLAYNLFRSERTVVVKEPNKYKRYYNYAFYTIEEDYEPKNMDDLKNIIFNYLNNGWDEFTFYCPEDYETCLDDVKLLSKNSNILSSINNYVNPYNSFNNIYTKLSSDGSITLTLSRAYSDEMIEQTEKYVDNVLKKLKLDNISSTERKIKKIHDYLIDNFEYDKNENNKASESTTAYGAFKNGIAICSGYADAMAIILDRLEIPNLKVASDTHVWNLVYINGKWLHLDATWDDPVNAITDSNKYVYFLISNKKLQELDKETHVFNNVLYKETIEE